MTSSPSAAGAGSARASPWRRPLPVPPPFLPPPPPPPGVAMGTAAPAEFGPAHTERCHGDGTRPPGDVIYAGPAHNPTPGGEGALRPRPRGAKPRPRVAMVTAPSSPPLFPVAMATGPAHCTAVAMVSGSAHIPISPAHCHRPLPHTAPWRQPLRCYGYRPLPTPLPWLSPPRCHGYGRHGYSYRRGAAAGGAARGGPAGRGAMPPSAARWRR